MAAAKMSMIGIGVVGLEQQRTRAEAEILAALIATPPDYLDAFGLAYLVFRDQEFAVGPGDQFGDGLHQSRSPLKPRHELEHSILTIASRNAVEDRFGVQGSGLTGYPIH